MTERPAVALGFAIKGTVFPYLVNLSMICFGRFHHGRAKTKLIPTVFATILQLLLSCSITRTWKGSFMSPIYLCTKRAPFTKSMIKIPSLWAGQARRDWWERDIEDSERRRPERGKVLAPGPDSGCLPWFHVSPLLFSSM